MNLYAKKSGYIISFYSYKGGVGRSMALANTACLLADRQILEGEKILIMDWDLGAPGLHKFFPETCNIPKNEKKSGVIDYFARLEKLLDNNPKLYKEISGKDGWKSLNRMHPIEKYLIRGVYAGLDLIKAGHINSRYPEKVSLFDWVSFHQKYNGIFRTFSDLLSNKYSYCLIDSQTGFTDTSGVCTMLLPEKLVVVFTPNEQSSQGAIDLTKLAIDYRRSSTDMRPLSVFPLPSRVDESEEELRKEWRANYQSAFEEVFISSYGLQSCDLTSYFDEVKLPHKSYYAYGEALAVKNERNESLSLHRAYKTFYDLLIKMEPPWKPITANIVDHRAFTSAETLSRTALVNHPRVMISSTVRDLADHRDAVRNACMRLGMFYPDMMENLTAADLNAVEISREMINRADIYIGIFGYKYGYVPKNQTRSIIELEYESAVERGIPRLIFLMSGEHPIKASDIEETGEGTEKLKRLKERLKKEQVVSFFNSADDLRGQVVQALVPYREVDLQTFHARSEIPSYPEAYIAHPYTLLQTHDLVGRQQELNLLTDWVSKPDSDIYKAHILSIVAIGGMGKSALTWKWFEEIALEEMKPLAGRMWWSFYESDASFENFIIRALAYVSKRSIEEVQQIPPPDREMQLLNILDKEPFLLVLDGLERILIAYARMDAAYLSDSDYDKQTSNFVANAYGLPASAAQSFMGEHLVRRTADPRAGAFLRKLSRVRAARILISTRLYPFDLQRGDALPLPGCYALFLSGLSNDDALNLWRSFGVSGSHDQLLSFFNSFGNHALLIQALASEVANYRIAPGDFEKWREANPDFDPAKYPHIQDAMGHVLEYALRGLGDEQRNVLQTIAGFRMPTHYDTLSAVLIGEGKPCDNAGELDAALVELEDRGLVGWDKRANRYDLHPIVRGVVWNGLGDDARQGVYTSLHAHFEGVPMIEDYLDVNSLEDLTPAIELYNTLIGLGRYNDAVEIFSKRLNEATLYRLSEGRQRVELLEMLFPKGLDQLPPLRDRGSQAFTIQALAQGYKFIGLSAQAAQLLRRAITIELELGNDESLCFSFINLSDTLRRTGELYESERSALRALRIAKERGNLFNEVFSLQLLGSTLAVQGKGNDSEWPLLRSARIVASLGNKQLEGLNKIYLAKRALWIGDFNTAQTLGDQAWKLALALSFEGDFIRAARVQGKAALGLDNLVLASERLHHALARARAVNLVEEELPALVALAELQRRQANEKAAREFLDDLWEYAERGPYPILHSDALNVLAQIERDTGNTDKAIEAATKAYQLAWCDGPPHAYHWGLVKAQKHLEELGAPLPEMPPFDESKFEPMPEVEIDPEDEYHKGL